MQRSIYTDGYVDTWYTKNHKEGVSMQRKVILYIAMSLDGFIADVSGGVDWLKGNDEANEEIKGYKEFYESIDTIVLGRTTYDQIHDVLSPNIWPYEDKNTYVITHQPNEDKPNIHFVGETMDALIHHLRQIEGKHIWICGGAQIVQQAQAINLIDEYHITIIPRILGDGIRLFAKDEQKLFLEKTYEYNGFVDLIYHKK